MIDEKWEKVLNLIWKRSRFTSYFFQSVLFLESLHIPTLALTLSESRLTLFYNKIFIQNLTIEELIGLLVHEMLHIFLNHNHRGNKEEEINIQNLSQDMVINSYIYENHKSFFSKKGSYQDDIARLILPKGLPVIPKEFFIETGIKDPLWEEVFKWLINRKTSNVHDENFNSPSYISNNISDNIKKEVSYVNINDMKGIAFYNDDNEIIASGIHVLGNQKYMENLNSKKYQIISYAQRDEEIFTERIYNEITSLISLIKEVDIKSWKNQIKSVIDFCAQSNEWYYTPRRFNRRYFASSIYAPGRTFKEQEFLTVAIDVSASMIMNPEEIQEAFGVIEELSVKYKIHLICIDEDVFIPKKIGDYFHNSRQTSKPYEYKKGDWQFIKTGSSGTTFFSPLFNKFMKKHKEMLVIITDGCIYDIEKLRRYTPTLWVISGNRTEPFIAPFGSMVTVNLKKNAYEKRIA